MGSAPHVREVYSCPRCLPFFILPEPYSPNGNSHLDHNASIEANFLKEVPFGCRDLQKTLRVTFAPKIEKISYLLQKHEILE
jgi:hypothetical protein